MTKKIITIILSLASIFLLTGCTTEDIEHSISYHTRNVVETFSIEFTDLSSSNNDTVVDIASSYFEERGYVVETRDTNVLTLTKTYTYSDFNQKVVTSDTIYEYSLFTFDKTTYYKASSLTGIDDFVQYLSNHTLGGVDVEEIECEYNYLTDYKSIKTNADLSDFNGREYIHTWRYTLAEAQDLDVILTYTGINSITWYAGLTLAGLFAFLIPYLILSKKHIGDNHGTTQNNA